MMIDTKHFFLTGAAALSLAMLPAAQGQAPAAQPASIQGHAQDEVGIPIKDGEVRFTQDVSKAPADRKYLYTFKTDANGDFKGTGIAPGSYLIVLFRGTTSVDFQTTSPRRPRSGARRLRSSRPRPPPPTTRTSRLRPSMPPSRACAPI